MSLHLYLLSRTLIHCFIFLLPYTEMIHPIPSGTREPKGLAQDCTASYWQSAKPFTPRPVSFYHVPRNKAPGRWLWRKVNVPVQGPEDSQHWMSSHQVLVNLEVLWPLEGGRGRGRAGLQGFGS